MMRESDRAVVRHNFAPRRFGQDDLRESVRLLRIEAEARAHIDFVDGGRQATFPFERDRARELVFSLLKQSGCAIIHALVARAAAGDTAQRRFEQRSIFFDLRLLERGNS